MNREELIKTLLKNDLNKFRFSVWATYNDNGNLVYALSLAGEKPLGYEIHLFDIGGNSEIKYMYDYIDFVIYDAIDEFYDKTGRIL